MLPLEGKMTSLETVTISLPRGLLTFYDHDHVHYRVMNLSVTSPPTAVQAKSRVHGKARDCNLKMRIH